MKTVFMDGTFKSFPKLFYQLFIIHGAKDNNYFPLVFFLLPNKNSTTYIQAFRFKEHHIMRPEIFQPLQNEQQTVVNRLMEN